MRRRIAACALSIALAVGLAPGVARADHLDAPLAVGAVEDALQVASEGDSAVTARYEGVINAWRARIAADKNWTFDDFAGYDEEGMEGTVSIRWASDNMAKVGDNFVYGYVDLGYAGVPALLVADPDDAYSLYGIYQCYGAGDGYDMALHTKHMREHNITYCGDGVFTSLLLGVAVEYDGRVLNATFAAMRAKLRAGDMADSLDLATEKGISYYSKGDPYYWKYESQDNVIFHESGRDEALAAFKSSYPADTSVEWHGIYDTFVAPDLSHIKGGLMHRLYNPNSGEHFYTSSAFERDSVSTAGWMYENIGWIAPKTSGTPVYRLYNANGGEHHYTMSAVERDMLLGAGWSDEGIGWYSDDAETVPLYREYNPNAFANNHNYTTSKAEHDHLISLGWKDEGTAWYGV